MENLEVVQFSSPPSMVRGRGKNKKFWSDKEEQVLIDILIELNYTNWKTEKGYKNGYCYNVEKRLEEELPGCGLRADPHIESKIKSLRRTVAHILTIEENGDEFWWDEEQKMVVGNKNAFLAWAKNHEVSSSLFTKPFLHYDKLCETFGKRRPSKKRVRVPTIDTPIARTNSGNETQSNIREDATSNTHSTIVPPSEDGSEKVKKLRELDPSETEFLEMSKTIRNLAEVQKDLSLTMIDMKKASSHDVEIREQRKKLFSILTNLPGLSPLDVVKAARSIGSDDRKVDVFFSMPDDYKLLFAQVEIVSSLH